MKHTEFKFKTFDELQLFGQIWQPEGQLDSFLLFPRKAVWILRPYLMTPK